MTGRTFDGYKLRWEVSTGEPKVTQRNRQANRGMGRKVRVRGG